MTGDSLSLTGAVFTVICVLMLAYWCSRLLGKGWMKASSGRNIKVIEQLQVGNDRQLLLIRVHNQVFLVGVSAAGIRLLSEIEGDFPVTAIPEAEFKDKNFLEILKKHAVLHQQKKGETNE